MIKRGCKIIAVDADPNVFKNVPDNIKIYNKAISVYTNKKVMIYNKLEQGAFTSEIRKYWDYDGVEIETITLNEISPKEEYDILKIDIEGSEYDLLSNKDFKPLPKQISVEFHEHTFKEIHDCKFSHVIKNLSKWYELVYTMKDNFYENVLYQYADCLFIRK